MANVIHIAGTIPDGQAPKAFWAHVVGLVLLDMKDRGWAGGKILDAVWKDGLLAITVGPGSDEISVDALTQFFHEKKGRKA